MKLNKLNFDGILIGCLSIVAGFSTHRACINQYSAHKSIVYGNGHDPQPALIVEGRYREVRLKQPHVDVSYLCIETDYSHHAFCLSPAEWIKLIHERYCNETKDSTISQEKPSSK